MFSAVHIDELDRLAPFRYEGRLAKVLGKSKAKRGTPERQFAESLLTQTGESNNAQPKRSDGGTGITNTVSMEPKLLR